jgi:hypothetical protein
MKATESDNDKVRASDGASRSYEAGRASPRLILTNTKLQVEPRFYRNSTDVSP